MNTFLMNVWKDTLRSYLGNFWFIQFGKRNVTIMIILMVCFELLIALIYFFQFILSLINLSNILKSNANINNIHDITKNLIGSIWKPLFSKLGNVWFKNSLILFEILVNSLLIFLIHFWKDIFSILLLLR